MNFDESLILRFLRGESTAQALDRAVTDACEYVSPRHERFYVIDMAEHYDFTRKDALTLLDAAHSGHLSPSTLAQIAFLLIASDAFVLPDDDDVVIDVLHDLSSPEINLPLIPGNLHWFRRVLLNELPYAPKPRVPSGPLHERLLRTVERRPAIGTSANHGGA